jgi:hypothetical protein
MAKRQRISEEESKRRPVTEALGESGTNFTALANLILDDNRQQAERVASTAQHEAWMAKRGLEYTKAPVEPVKWSAEEINGLADFCATKGETFNREEWFAYLGNLKKVWVVNFSLSGLPLSNDEGTVVQRRVDDEDFGDDYMGFANGVDYLVEAETPGNAEELLTEWLDKWELKRTRLAQAHVVTEFHEAIAAIECVTKK